MFLKDFQPLFSCTLWGFGLIKEILFLIQKNHLIGFNHVPWPRPDDKRTGMKKFSERISFGKFILESLLFFKKLKNIVFIKLI